MEGSCWQKIFLMHLSKDCNDVEVVKDRCDMLDEYEVGQKVQLNFDIRGNEYKDRYYVNLSCWKIQAAEGGDGGGAPAAAAPASGSEPSAADLRKEDDFDDDIPF